MQPSFAGVADKRAWIRLGNVCAIGLCTLWSLVATLAHSPLWMPYVWADGGVFLYVAQQLRQGAVLYREVWDHKPPLIYWINLVGLSASNGSRWGLWALEFAAVGTAVLTGYFLLRRAFGQTIALLVTWMWLLTWVSFSWDGNFTETFALPLQFVCLALACEIETGQRGVYQWRRMFLGILVGLIFWLKPNEIGIGLAIAVYVVLQAARRRTWRDVLTKLAPMLLGFGLVTTGVLIPFVLQGALGDLFDTVFIFNFIYSRRDPFIASRVDALFAGYKYLSVTSLLILGALGFVSGVSVLLWARARLAKYPRTLLGISALALPIEIVMVLVSGRPFDHYFMALLYVLAVWSAWLLWILQASILLWLQTNAARARIFVGVGLVLSALALSLPALRQDYLAADNLRQQKPPELVTFIQTHTTPSDTVEVWGLEARLLFFAGRRAPTKYPHSNVFQHPRYATPQLVEDYFAEILRKRPALIIDSRNFGLNNFTVARSPKIDDLIDRLRQNYRSLGKMGGMTVYELIAP